MISVGDKLTKVSPNDKPWNAHKKENIKIRDYYGQNPKYFKYADRMAECGNWLQFGEVENHDRKLKLQKANFCHVRHCPICQWRKSLARIARFMNNLPAYMEKAKDYSYIYIVLTTRNCSMDELRDTIKAQNDGVKKLLKRLERSGVAIHGYIRTNEVTKGKDGNPHPHVNLILAVNKTYFTHSSSYIKKDEWIRLWRESMRLDYDPSVFVSRVKKRKKKDKEKNGNSPESDLISGILEVSKYSVKPSDISNDAQFLYGITEQCHKLRFLSTGGCFKDVFKNPDRVESDDQDDNISDDEMLLKNTDSEGNFTGWVQLYWWHNKDGYLLRVRKKVDLIQRE